MLFSRKQKIVAPQVQIIRDVSLSPEAFGCDAVLVHVKNGKGALGKNNYMLTTGRHGIEYVSMVELNGRALVHMQSDGCPTCDCILAAGYGLNEDCAELKQISENLNSNYQNITSGVENLFSLLGLLKDGIYMVADIPYYPANGSGKFFWDIDAELTDSRATGVVWGEDYNLLESFPAFLYPSEPDSKYDDKRVRFYAGLYDEGIEPRAVAYHLCNYMSLLLDGHHKACAAAIGKRCVRALTIFEVEGCSVKDKVNLRSWAALQKNNISGIYIGNGLFDAAAFTDEQLDSVVLGMQTKRNGSIDTIDCGQIFGRIWEDEYQAAAFTCPTVDEVAFIGSDICCHADKYLDTNIFEPAGEIISLLSYLARCKDGRVKHIALNAARKSKDIHILTAAFKALDTIKGDEEVDDFFVDYLVNCDIYYSGYNVLYAIANNHWNNSNGV